MTVTSPDRLDRLIDMLLWRLEVEGLLPDQQGWSGEGFYRDRFAAVAREVLRLKAPEI